MKKVFISIPMNNRPITLIVAEMDNIRRQLSAALSEPIEMLDSIVKEEYDSPLMYIAKSIETLSEADCAYFADGWENARGCRIEHECCKDYGIEILNDKVEINSI